MNIRGIEIELHPNEDLSNHIRRENDFFEAEILDYLRDNHKQQKTILDIGANIGNHSIYFVNFLDYELLVAFEPIPANYALLKKNMKSYQDIMLVEAAISATTEPIHMFENKQNMGNSRVHMDGDIYVKGLALDRLSIDNVTLMKIDVEGHEPAVLAGAQDTIYKNKPLILIEDWELRYGNLLPDHELEIAWPHHKTYLYRSKYA